MAFTYPQIQNLDKLEVYHEDDPNNPQYFNVTGLPDVLGFGKYWFTLSFNDPNGMPLIKENSEIVFEVKDENGLIIYSDVTDLDDVDGAAICWLYIKEDPLRTYEEIADGIGTLTIMATLDLTPPSDSLPPSDEIGTLPPVVGPGEDHPDTEEPTGQCYCECAQVNNPSYMWTGNPII